MRPTVKKLILGMLFARSGMPINVRELIAAAAVFDISANTVRVSLVRLSAEGLIQASGRGAYRLGSEAEALANYAADWREAEEQLGNWPGNYLLVHTSNLGRSDRKALRNREKALKLCGLRELERGLFLRPNNLRGGAKALRYRLERLGVSPELMVLVADEFTAEVQAKIAGLWSSKALNSGYVESTQRIERWLATSASLEVDVAARESWLLGSSAIRQLIYDPWLPEPMVNTQLRQAFFDAAQRIDTAGKKVWNALELNGPASESRKAPANETNFAELNYGVLQ